MVFDRLLKSCSKFTFEGEGGNEGQSPRRMGARGSKACWHKVQGEGEHEGRRPARAKFQCSAISAQSLEIKWGMLKIETDGISFKSRGTAPYQVHWGI